MDDKIVRVPEQKIDFVSVIIDEFQGITQKVVHISADYQSVSNDRFIIVDTACTITLPIANKGKLITVKSTASVAITIQGNGTETIDGAGATALTTIYERITLLFNGTEWSEI